MRARLTELPELSASDLEEWRRLAARAAEPNVFHEPEYLIPLAEELELARDVALLVAEDADGWQACLPVHSGRWKRAPGRAVSSWRGHDLYSLLGTPLCAPEHIPDGLAAILSGMLRGRSTSFAALEWMGDDGPVARGLAEVLEGRRPAPVRYERFERAVLHRRDEETYLEGLKPKHRREFRRQKRKLGELLGGDPRIVDRAGEAGAPEELMKLEAANWKGRTGTPLSADPRHAAFFRRLCRSLAEQDRLQMLFLTVSGRSVAAGCNMVSGDTVFCLKIGFDEEFARLSPGVLLEVEMVKFFHERPIAKSMDSCAYSGNQMINRLWPDRRSLATWLVPSKGAVGMAVPALVKAREIRDKRRGGDEG